MVIDWPDGDSYNDVICTDIIWRKTTLGLIPIVILTQSHNENELNSTLSVPESVHALVSFEAVFLA